MSSLPSAEVLERALARERQAKKNAEDLLEAKSRELYLANKETETQLLRLQMRTKGLELLHDLAVLTQNDMPTQYAINTFVKTVCSKFHWPVGHFFLVDKEENRLQSSGTWAIAKDSPDVTALKEKTVEMTLVKGLGVPGSAWVKGSAVYVSDIQSKHDLPRYQVMQDTGIKALFAVPVSVYDEVIAVAEFFAFDTKEIKESFIKVVETAAIQLGTVLERRQSETTIKANYEKLKETVAALNSAQAQLVQSEKMSSVGQLAAGVAHEINNPMGFILSNLNTLKSYIESFVGLINQYDDLVLDSNQSEKINQEKLSIIQSYKEEQDIDFLVDDSVELLNDALEGGKRVADIVQGLKQFSHVDNEERAMANINDCIETTLKMVNNEIKYNCEVVKKLNDLPETACEAGKLNQVFMNFLINASQAIEGNGVITVETKQVMDKIVIVISDTGVGIPEENISELFTPFFTTKAVGTGTGLGLSISYGIIEEHQGSIDVKSEVGKGTSFEITLPIIRA